MLGQTLMEVHREQEALFLRNELDEVVDFVRQAHKGQTRKKSSIPYWFHPMAVFDSVHQWGVVDPVTLKAALCHDVLEDCPVNFEDLKSKIGGSAAHIVRELTFYRPMDRRTTAEAKAAYLESFGLQNGTSQKSARALVIKVADRCHNTRDFICTDANYARIYWSKAQALFRAVGDREDEVEALFGHSTLMLLYSEVTEVARLVQPMIL